MADSFTIADGLEIIGPLKTEGPTSVYKGRRSGRGVSVVKLLPLPVLLGRTADDQLKYVKDELLKLKGLGKSPHPNIVSILNTGISKPANCFYIEMALVEGPDLDELLQLSGTPVFTVAEILKVADHLCNALEHFHSMGIKHGDIKPNNVKRQANTGNYVLVDFGSTVLPGQQLRSDLTRVGMDLIAPEQLENKVLYQTDIYGFGLILFRLLAGSARTAARNDGINLKAVSNQEKSFPDLLRMRRNNIPSSWDQEEREKEMLVPGWLLRMVGQCLETNPDNRFANGKELAEHFRSQKVIIETKPDDRPEEGDAVLEENKMLAKENEELRAALSRQEFNDKIMYRQWKEIKEALSQKELELEELKRKVARPALSVTALTGLGLIAILLGALASYLLLPGRLQNQVNHTPVTKSVLTDTIAPDTARQIKKNRKISATPSTNESTGKTAKLQPPAQQQPAPSLQANNSPGNITNTRKISPAEASNNLGEYKVKSRAYFHNEPDGSTRRKAYITHWNNAIIKALDDQEGFIYVVFTNHLNQTSHGWLNKNDLERVN